MSRLSSLVHLAVSAISPARYLPVSSEKDKLAAELAPHINAIQVDSRELFCQSVSGVIAAATRVIEQSARSLRNGKSFSS